MPQATHASRRENSWSPPSYVLMTTMSSARPSAVSSDSERRRSMPDLTIRRSTTMSMLWLRRRSSLMSSSSDRNWPSILALPAADDRREHVDARVVRIEHHQVENPLERLRRDLAPAVVAMRRADVGEQQPHVIVDFGDGADGGARVRAGGLLLDGDRGREAFDQVDVGLLHLLEELARVGRERLDVPALSFRVDGVEGQRRLSRTGQTGNDDQLVAREIDVDILEVVNAGAAHRDPVVPHTPMSGNCRKPEMIILPHAQP